MCAIAGIIGFETLSQDSVEQMLRTMTHRGPDGIGYINSDFFDAGMCRLSINDIEKGSQPLSNENGSIQLLYNGEIYNSPLLRRQLLGCGHVFNTNSDGEVICHLYEEEGISALSKLDGMFAGLLFDSHLKKVYLFRDQLGEKPLFIYKDTVKPGLIFASQISAFEKIKGVTLSLNRQAIWNMPTFLWVPEPNTIYNEITAVPPGGIISISIDGVVENSRNNAFECSDRTRINDDEVVFKIRETVYESVNRRLLSDVPLGCFLSGGLDSSIVAKIAGESCHNMKTFCVSFDDACDPFHKKFDESALAEEFASHIGSEHHTVHASPDSILKSIKEIVKKADQPFAVSSGFGVFLVGCLAREMGVKVLLSGDCADELFGGYSWYNYFGVSPSKLLPEGQNLSSLSFQTIGLGENERAAIINSFEHSHRAWAWHYFASEYEKEQLFHNSFFPQKMSSLTHFANLNEALDRGCSLPRAFIDNDREVYLTNEMLMKVDRMLMASSVEGRVPFASLDLFKIALRLTDDQLVRDGVLKWALREAFKDDLPKNLLERPKHGFNFPIENWLRNEWFDLLMHCFSNDSALYRLGFVSPDASDKAVALLYDKKKLHGHTLLSFMMLNLWLEERF